jgi:hypothetical protein
LGKGVAARCESLQRPVGLEKPEGCNLDPDEFPHAHHDPFADGRHVQGFGKGLCQSRQFLGFAPPLLCRLEQSDLLQSDPCLRPDRFKEANLTGLKVSGPTAAKIQDAQRILICP